MGESALKMFYNTLSDHRKDTRVLVMSQKILLKTHRQSIALSVPVCELKLDSAYQLTCISQLLTLAHNFCFDPKITLLFIHLDSGNSYSSEQGSLKLSSLLSLPYLLYKSTVSLELERYKVT